eukprot:TRINITY_DN13716_c0_g1_i2.p1 TRINITY_DN13716_c0_g1~~TRINITY_DN13716_c0_g1_i2.p1  ORF type:complete len:376 (+),score=78.49 TRINITY_DN13716_c0_g1_i2:69-1196(+)
MSDALWCHKHGGPIILLDAQAARLDHLNEAEGRLLTALQAAGGILGLDLEWLPDRNRSENNKVALVQLAIGDSVWLIRTCQISLPESVRMILLDPNVVKLVASFDSKDRAKLADSFNIHIGDDHESYGFLDISAVARACELPATGVKSLCREFGYKIAKEMEITCSDWASGSLTQEQVRYAADDAFFLLLVAAQLLQQPAVLSEGGLRQHAAAACSMVLPVALEALCTSGCTERAASARAVLREVCDVVDLESQKLGGSVALAQLPRLLRKQAALRLQNEAQERAPQFWKSFLKKHREYFCLHDGQVSLTADGLELCSRNLVDLDPCEGRRRGAKLLAMLAEKENLQVFQMCSTSFEQRPCGLELDACVQQGSAV